MGASFEERRMKLLRMIALRKAIERAEKAYEALRGDALADALARVDKVEAHAAEIAAERDAARDAAELAEGTVAALRDRLGEMERERDTLRAVLVSAREMMPTLLAAHTAEINAERDKLAEVERLRDEARAALAQARRDGAEAMREASAGAADRVASEARRLLARGEVDPYLRGEAVGAETCAEAIRAIPADAPVPEVKP